VTILGIDYGRVHVGLAVGHEEPRLALPRKTISGVSRASLLEMLATLAKEEAVDKVVVGLPRAQRPEQETGEGFRADVEAFCAVLEERVGLPVVQVDERFTSRAAAILRRDYPPADEHALAAMLIVDTYLDKRLYEQDNQH